MRIWFASSARHAAVEDPLLHVILIPLPPPWPLPSKIRPEMIMYFVLRPAIRMMGSPEVGFSVIVSPENAARVVAVGQDVPEGNVLSTCSTNVPLPLPSHAPAHNNNVSPPAIWL